MNFSEKTPFPKEPLSEPDKEPGELLLRLLDREAKLQCAQQLITAVAASVA